MNMVTRKLQFILQFVSFFVLNCIFTEAVKQAPPIVGYEFLKKPQIHVYTDLNSGADSGVFGGPNHGEKLKKRLEDVTQDDTFQMEFSVYNRTFMVMLEPNYDLIHPEATMRINKPGGVVETTQLNKERGGMYKGHVKLVGPEKELNKFEQWERMLRKREQFAFEEEENWARISIRDIDGYPTIDGSYYFEGETYYIKPIEIYKFTKRKEDPEITTLDQRHPDAVNSRSIIYRQSEYNNIEYELSKNSKSRCGVNHEEMKLVQHARRDLQLGFEKGSGRRGLFKRDTPFNNPAALTAGCLEARKILYIGVAADCTYTANFSSEDSVRTQILNIINQVSAVYERQFNIALGVIEMQIESSACSTVDPKKAWNRACSSDYSIQNRLSDFSTWRGDKGNDGAGLWHLLTRCASGTEVGLAWVGAICQVDAITRGVSAGVYSGTGISALLRDDWRVVAHEIGHNFGAVHDCTSQECPCAEQTCNGCCPCTSGCDCNGQYIMNPSTSSSTSTNDFSPCSVKYMCSKISSTGVQCLQDPGTRKTIGIAMCGNGILEAGEECDCGTSDSCKSNPCCDWQTCKLKSGAKCSDSNNLCCKNCQLQPSGTVCRQKISECDITQYCDGVNKDCPADIHVKDGTNCGAAGSGLKCASGTCTSRDAQCAARDLGVGYNKYCSLSMSGNPCDIQCQDPKNFNMCVITTGSFLEGTYCGLHSYCRSGVCKGDNVFYDFLNLYLRALYISIPLTILAVVILFFLLGCCVRTLRDMFGRRKRMQPVNVIPVPVNPYHSPPQYPQHNIPPPANARFSPPNNQRGHPFDTWVDPTPYNGTGYNQGPRR